MSPSFFEPSVQGIEDTTGIIVPDPLRVLGVSIRREKAPRLVAGVAATSDLNVFKGTGQHDHKPKARKWDHRLSSETTSRQPSSLKGAARYLSKPGLISLGGGLPSPEYFPFGELSLKVPAIGKFSEEETSRSGVVLTSGKHDLRDEKSLFDISTALNYGLGTGSAQLLRWIVEHTEICHRPLYRDWACTMTIGSTSALDMVLRMFKTPSLSILTEKYTFASAIETAKPMGVKVFGVEMDEEGMQPRSLDNLLNTWDPLAHDGLPKPFLVYTVPTGQNPTGATQSLQRRREIYFIAQKHDLLIIEDDPYYFLQMQPYMGQNVSAAPIPKTHEDFLESLVPSYLSLDTDGRVVRLDSFSKVVAPGSRIGWITAPEQITERYFRHSDVSTQSPSGFSQLALFKLLDEHWGHGGYLDWLVYIRLEYSKRRDVILGACEKHLPLDVVQWRPPQAGMFHWLEIDWRKHPESEKLSLVEIEERIWLKAIEKGTLLIRGGWFSADREKPNEKMFFRTTFASAPSDKIQEGIRRFGEALREEFDLHQTLDGPVKN